MKTATHQFHIRSKNLPVIEYDPVASAVYVRFSKNKVAKTIESRKNHDVYIDLDSKGGVVGIEALSIKELRVQRIESIVKRASGTDVDFSNAAIRLPEPALS